MIKRKAVEKPWVPTRENAIATMKTAIIGGLATTSSRHNIRWGENADMIIDEIVKCLLNPSTVWALSVAARAALEGTEKL